MNYEQPRQVTKEGLPDTGKWRWTTRNDNSIRASGYCASWDVCPENHGFEDLFAAGGALKCATCGGKGIVEKPDPCPGHNTAEEAAEHFRQYRIDRAEFVSVQDADARTLTRCRVCDKHTASYMHVPGEIHTEAVCDDHHDRATAERLIELTMEVMHS